MILIKDENLKKVVMKLGLDVFYENEYQQSNIFNSIKGANEIIVQSKEKNNKRFYTIELTKDPSLESKDNFVTFIDALRTQLEEIDKKLFLDFETDSNTSQVIDGDNVNVSMVNNVYDSQNDITYIQPDKFVEKKQL